MIKFELIVKNERLLEEYKHASQLQLLDFFSDNPMKWIMESEVSVNIGTRCLDCGKPLEDPNVPGILADAWCKTNNHGKTLGFVCHDCSVYGKEQKEKGDIK